MSKEDGQECISYPVTAGSRQQKEKGGYTGMASFKRSFITKYLIKKVQCDNMSYEEAQNLGKKLDRKTLEQVVAYTKANP